ncbi:enoyl-CoA hydratase [Sphingobium sp. LB126]|uniref:enoyl-CoA hydratase/isomerase family protein n=1 Tax=Sphingobium sp. LB126 TaxID=1983755 RepID=UPI000C209CD6|nr:enoyl-CoA hydratase-related protein [Sphingobium sp. LB126]PJG46414.1 enoyl-CoA hydratase [Sphingobium sp. LB126]
MDFGSYDYLRFERRGAVLHATINRPDTLNAIDIGAERELVRMVREVSEDKETLVLVITGAGRAFSAGGNLDAIEAIIDHPDEFYDNMYQSKQLIFSVLDCPKPIIAKVNGHAIGLGATLALFCDIIVASAEAKFADPHVKIGFVAGDGGAVIWPQLVGHARAKEYLMTGDTIGAVEAERIGLINHVVPAEELDAKVDALADRLAAGSPRAIQWTKQSVNIGLKQIAHSVMNASMTYEVLSGRTEDHREAIRALREKRKPVFTGK